MISWILKVIKSNLKHARLFGSTLRFIDHLTGINDGGLFVKNYTKIYPPELKLKMENKNNAETTFLDLDI